MISLPRFTFLCGPPSQGQGPLTRALIHEDDNLIRIDFTYPIQEIITTLFPDSCPVTLDPLDNMSTKVHPDYTVTLRDVMAGYVYTQRRLFGTDALGKFAHRKCLNEGTFSLFDRLIFPDCTDPEDAQVFIDQSLASDCLAVFMGDLIEIKALGFNDLLCRKIWLPVTDPLKNTETLRKELNHERPTGRASGVSTGA